MRFLLFSTLLILIACGDDAPSFPPCTPGEQQACTCSDGSEGAQVCAGDGQSFEPCSCGGDGGAGGSGGSAGGIQCGDDVCPLDECCPSAPIEACTDLMQDDINCGQCGHVCPGEGAPNGSPDCENGLCGMSCMPPWLDCNGDAADGCEHNSETQGPC